MHPRKLTEIFTSLVAIVLWLSGAISGYSQVTGATLSGTVSDSSGAAISGAQISIRNAATGIVTDVMGNADGYYTAPNLAPGIYDVRVTANGFNTVLSTITLAVGAQQQLNIPMKVGEISQTIQVTQAAPQIDLTSSALTGQVESATILELPLNGRDWTSLATLQPGVNLIENQLDYAQSARGNRGFGAELTISGQRPTGNNYRLDAVSVNDYANSGPGNVIGAALGVDAIQEFSVLTGSFPAEYGKATGGVVNAITKSGTNSFHGDAYEVIRNSALDSRDYFSRSANTPLAQFRRNQFGAAAGGPIIKDKTFIFGDYEGFRQAKGITTTVTVPSDNARAGNLVSGPVTVSPGAAAELAMFPHATPGTSVGDKGKFIHSGLQIVPENFYTARVDHKISKKDSLFGTYLFDTTDFTQPDSFNNVILKSHTGRQTVVIEENHTFSPSVVDAARMQYNFIARVEQGGRWNFSNLSSFLTNSAKHFEAGIPATISPRELRQTLVAGYVQDDWRFRQNLTLNLGLRYEMVTTIKDAQGKTTSLLNISDPAPQCGVQFTAPFAPGGKQPAGSVCGSVGPYYHNPTLRNFEPRVGFAWDPFRSGKTSVRGGFGIYDVLPLPGYFLVLEGQAAPFMIFASVDKPISGSNPLKGQFPGGGQNLLTNPPTGFQPGKLSTSIVEANPHRNYVLEWNLNVQRQITQDLSLNLGYVGSHGVHMLIRGDDGNVTLPTLTSAGYFFPASPKINQSLGTIRYLFWGSDAFYDAMNVELDKRMSHGLQFKLSYTWSKSIDDDSATIAGDTFGNSLNSLYWFAPKSLRGLSDFNIAQSAAISALWALPAAKSFNGLARTALGGWQAGGILKINSGVPTTVIFNGDPAGLGNNGADQFGIPNRIPGCDPVNHNYIGGTSPSYINANCYTLPTVSASSPLAAQCGTFSGAATPPPSGQVYCANLLGNAGRNTLIGPKFVNVDFSATKNFPIHRISENFNVQFRAEIFNIFNHSNFLPPEPLAGAGIFDATGAVTTNGFMDTLATQPRDVQFALKVIW